MFESYLMSGGEQQMHVLRHDHERMDLKSAFTAITIQSLQEKAHIIFDNKESSPLPGGGSYEISSDRGDESSRLQEQTSATEAAFFAQAKPARVKLVSFPIIFFAVAFPYWNKSNG
jgi:hypothetical protein